MTILKMSPSFILLTVSIFKVMYEQNPTTLLQQQLSALSSTNWQQQLEIIDSLPRTPQIVKLINNRNYSSDIASLLACQNPRSKLVTKLTEYLMGLFSQYCNQLTSFANLLVSNDCLLRLLASGNKVVAASANELLKCIISNTDFKEKGKSIKYVRTLQNQFLTSKNGFVREKISLYFLFIATSYHYNSKDEVRQFERKVVKPGLEDACEKVRKNMKEILVNLSHFQKQNQISSFEEKPKKYYPKKTIKDMGSKVIYSSICHDSLINHSKSEDMGESKIESSAEKARHGEQISTNNYEFYLQRLQNGDSWSMIIIAFETLVNMISRNALRELNNDKLYCQTIQKLIPLLGEKRGKVYEVTVKVVSDLIMEVLKEKRIKVLMFIEEHCSQMIEQGIKIETVGNQLLPIIIQVNPSSGLYKIAELSTQVKIHKYRLILMDHLVRGMERLGSERCWSKNEKKVLSLTKMMCQHFSDPSSKEKDIHLAALAVLSQLKSAYPSEVLTTLLSQNDKTLTKIIQIAESIDQTLKEALVDFIYTRKGNQKIGFESLLPKHPKDFREEIEIQMRMVIDNKTQKITRIGQLVLTHLNQLTEGDFSALLGLLEYLQTEDMIMQYRFLLEELAETINSYFITALMNQLKNNKHSKDKQYHTIMYAELLSLTIKNIDSRVLEHQEMLQKVCECFVEVYRSSESLKVRNSAIEGLSSINEELLGQYLKQNEFQLVTTYKMRLQAQSESEDDSLFPNFY